MSKFAESSNLALDVLYNRSGYELFRRVPCTWLCEVKRNYKKIYLDET